MHSKTRVHFLFKKILLSIEKKRGKLYNTSKIKR